MLTYLVTTQPGKPLISCEPGMPLSPLTSRDRFRLESAFSLDYINRLLSISFSLFLFFLFSSSLPYVSSCIVAASQPHLTTTTLDLQPHHTSTPSPHSHVITTLPHQHHIPSSAPHSFMDTSHHLNHLYHTFTTPPHPRHTPISAQ